MSEPPMSADFWPDELEQALFQLIGVWERTIPGDGSDFQAGIQKGFRIAAAELRGVLCGGVRKDTPPAIDAFGFPGAL